MEKTWIPKLGIISLVALMLTSTVFAATNADRRGKMESHSYQLDVIADGTLRHHRDEIPIPPPPQDPLLKDVIYEYTGKYYDQCATVSPDQKTVCCSVSSEGSNCVDCYNTNALPFDLMSHSCTASPPSTTPG